MNSSAIDFSSNRSIQSDTLLWNLCLCGHWSRFFLCIPDSHGQVGDGAQPPGFRWFEVQSLIATSCIDLGFLSLGISCPFPEIWPSWRLPANDLVMGHGYVSTTELDAEESMAFCWGTGFSVGALWLAIFWFTSELRAANSGSIDPC